MKKVILFLCLSGPLWVYGQPEGCGKPSGPQDVVNCIVKNHPNVLSLQVKVENMKAFQKLASQRPNPELDSEAVFRSESDEPDLTLEAAYLHTFELGKKRNKRRSQAKAQEKLLLAKLKKAQGYAVLNSVLNLHRLRHLEMELHVVEESLETFKKIIKQYKRRRRLSPEQEVSLNVFVLAEADYQLDKSKLLQEKEEIKTYFDLSTSISFDQIMAVLPKQIDQWPDINKDDSAKTLKSAQWQEVSSEHDLSKAELEIAKSQAWPDMQLGPKIEVESGNGSDSQGIGAALSLPLPFYNKNKGGIGVAETEAKFTEIKLNQIEKKIKAELTKLKAVYKQSTDALQKTPSLPEMESKHQKMERLFERGLVSAPLIIEAHRQMTEFTEHQNEQELQSLEALWSIYQLEGRILEESLQ